MSPRTWQCHRRGFSEDNKHEWFTSGFFAGALLADLWIGLEPKNSDTVVGFCLVGEGDKTFLDFPAEEVVRERELAVLGAVGPGREESEPP